MPNIGAPELIIVLVIALLIFGPKRLPGLGRQLGTGMREFKESITGKDRAEEDRGAISDRVHADAPAPPALDPAVVEPEVVTGEARREDQPASRADT